MAHPKNGENVYSLYEIVYSSFVLTCSLVYLLFLKIQEQNKTVYPLFFNPQELPKEAPAVDWAQSVLFKRLIVCLGAIAFVPLKPILRILL